MILYNITVKINHEVHDEWLRWMREEHIPDVMATDVFEEYKLSRLLGVDESDGVTYAVQYLASSMEAFHIYQEKHAYRLQTAHASRFPNQYVVFRTILSVVEQGR